MQLTSLSKALRTLGAIAMLSTITTTAVQQSAQACPNKAKSATAPAMAKESKTIVGIAASDPQFSTLVAAVKAAGLVDTLSGKTPLTVFAPTNEAFAALPAGTVENLLKPENRETLRKVLTYHVVPGAVAAKDLRSGQVKSAEGSAIAVQVANQKVKVNNANVIAADVKASNGIIHVIDRVILPPNF